MDQGGSVSQAICPGRNILLALGLYQQNGVDKITKTFIIIPPTISSQKSVILNFRHNISSGAAFSYVMQEETIGLIRMSVLSDRKLIRYKIHRLTIVGNKNINIYIHTYVHINHSFEVIIHEFISI